jgi:superfamily II DNA/RNA helicase
VLVPTRELASQVQAALLPLAEAVGLSVVTVFGGSPQRRQVAALRSRADIVVACPGRLADLVGQGHCHLGDVEVSVLDEADHMADLGFLPVVRRLLDATPAEGQRMLFSATLDKDVDVLVRRFLKDPASHAVDTAAAPPAMVHHVLTVETTERMAVLAALAGGKKRSLIFTRTKRAARRFARQLEKAGVPAAELHGDLAQRARERNLASFASGRARVMVATDIAARGIHVDDIGLVIHADPPAEHKAYLHRSGRTARAGADGVVITLQTAAQAGDVRTLMRKAKVTPLTAHAHPHSAVLRSIAGEPADPPATRPAPEQAPAVTSDTATGAGATATGARAGAGARGGAGAGAAAMSTGYRRRRKRSGRTPAVSTASRRAQAGARATVERQPSPAGERTAPSRRASSAARPAPTAKRGRRRS